MQKALVDRRKFTFEDYQKLPEGAPYELLEGELVMTPSPNVKHQRILKKLLLNLDAFVTEHDLGEVFAAPCDVYLDSENVVQPDLFFISKERTSIIGDKNIQGAPDLVVEIVSEGTLQKDTVKKKNLYEKFGVKEYWIVAPDERIIEVYTLEELGQYQLFHSFKEKESLESSLLKGFRLKLEQIFQFL